MFVPSEKGLEGGCPCRKVRYKMLDSPMCVHCCHCRWCQKETGTAFALNMIIEATNVELLSETAPIIVRTPSESGCGQAMARCPTCQFVVWSNYGDVGDRLRFVRAGTLDKPDQIRPSIHIYTASKMPWVQLDKDTPAVPEYYKREEVWPEESVERWKNAKSVS